MGRIEAKRALLWTGAVALVLLLVGCAPPEPLRVGFLGGVSGRVADLGIAGRDAALLAVEMRNARGGVDGRPVELLIEDDGQDPERAREALARLIARNVAAVVGPMTSAIALAVVPQANAARLTLVSPTVTTNALTGLDDHFFRVLAPTAAHVAKSADYYFHERGLHRLALIYDLRNKAYTESWASDFRAAFVAAGGVIVDEERFVSGEAVHFTELAAQLLDRSPDGVIVIANSVDTALLIQKIRQRDAAVAIGTSEWAATERLIELGGRAVEGVVVSQYLDRDSREPQYVGFREAYRSRFGREPGYPGLTAFDATNVVLDALDSRQSGQSLKQAILARREFAGAQGAIRFDAAGDSGRGTFLSVIRDGDFQPLGPS
ncbi:MAG TPA: ABC transporter substrate-binding protein [Rhodocyclaceae bacterium]